MKKLLTILLTLVMAICLVNLNYNHTKAEDVNGTTYIWTYGNTGWGCDQTAPSTYLAGDQIKIATTLDNITIPVTKPDGTIENATDDNTVTYTVVLDGASLQFNGSSSVIIKDAVPCDGLTYNSTNGWKNGATTLDTATGNNVFGIKKISDGVYKFTKELTITNNNGQVITINSPITIELDMDISLKQPDGYPCIWSGTDADTKIVGNGHTLTLTTAGTLTLGYFSELIFKNIMVNAKTNASGSPAFLISGHNLLLEGDCTINLNNADTSATNYALLFNGVGNKVISNQTPKGDRGGEPEEIELYNISGVSYTYVLKGTTNYASHVILRNVVPKPDPKPVDPEDKSCEKVIGPTWHWNNDKGICEEYGVVGTHTR